MSMRFMADLTLIRSFEERACNAWPAHNTLLVEGWMVRIGGGATKRANSASAYIPFPRPARVAVPAIEAIFTRADLPCVLRTSPLGLAEDPDWLTAQGYQPFEETLVLNAKLGDDTSPDDPDLTIEEALTPEWLAGFPAVQRLGETSRPALERIVHGIRLPHAFATLRENGKPVAHGLAVLERGLVGLYELAVAPESRRGGLGRRLTAGLMRWGREKGAWYAYLQVLEANSAARGMYEGLGFTEAYRQLYWKR